MPILNRDPISQADHELERKLQYALAALKRDPAQAVSREDAIWLLGAVLQQRDRICAVLRQAHDELEQTGLGEADLLTLMQQYSKIGNHK